MKERKKKQKLRVVNEVPLSGFETIVTPFCLFNNLFFQSKDGSIRLLRKMQSFLLLSEQS